MKSLNLILFISVFCFACAEKKQDKSIESDEKMSLNSGPPAAAWQDECGFAFEFSTNKVFALGTIEIVELLVLNDSTYQVIYPKQPVTLKNVKFDNYEGKSWVSYDNSGLSNCIDKKNKEILFGPDRLKYRVLAKNVIEIQFPAKSTWHFHIISEREMEVSNGKKKVKLTEFVD